MGAGLPSHQDRSHHFGLLLHGSLLSLLLVGAQVVRGGAPSLQPILPTLPRSTCVSLTADPGPYPDQSSALTGMAALSRREAWAVGYSQRIGALLEHWNGRRWRSYKLPEARPLSAITALSARTVWAVGDGAAWHWDGRHWCDEAAHVPILSAKHPGLLYGAAREYVTAGPQGTIWIAVVTMSGRPHDVIDVAYHDHTGWHAVGDPQRIYQRDTQNRPYLLAAARYPVLAAPTQNDVWLVNGFILNHWDGRRWSLVHSPLFPLSMYQQINQADYDAFATVSARDIWILGRYPNPTIGDCACVPLDYPRKYGPILAHWNGTAWRRMPSPFPVQAKDFLSGVAEAPDAATALATDDVWIARASQVARWEGQRWQRHDLPPALRAASILALSALSARDVWGVGTRTLCCYGADRSNAQVPLIAHWDGTRWHVVPNPLRTPPPTPTAQSQGEGVTTDGSSNELELLSVVQALRPYYQP